MKEGHDLRARRYWKDRKEHYGQFYANKLGVWNNMGKFLGKHNLKLTQEKNRKSE